MFRRACVKVNFTVGLIKGKPMNWKIETENARQPLRPHKKKFDEKFQPDVAEKLHSTFSKFKSFNLL